MSLKPRILITGSHKPNSIDPYSNAVERAGGVPVPGYLPAVTNEEMSLYDGLLIAGGCDVTPSLYGEEINGAVNTDINRDRCEMTMTDMFRRAGKPVFGICRGMQILNVFFGGTLIQDLPQTPDHRTYDNGNPTYHSAVSEKDSLINRLYGDRFIINSYHHEAVKTVNGCFRVTLRSDDSLKVAEAMEHRTERIFAVQFHPERMKSPAADGGIIFDYFISVCRDNPDI